MPPPLRKIFLLSLRKLLDFSIAEFVQMGKAKLKFFKYLFANHKPCA